MKNAKTQKEYSTMDEIRLLLAEVMIGWAHRIMPNSDEKIRFSQFILEYFNVTKTCHKE